MNTIPHCFTFKSNGKVREIIIEAGVSIPYDPQVDKSKEPVIHKIKSLWDTGATNCVISVDTVKKLGLIPSSFVNVTHGGGTELKPVYKINIYLPNKVFIPYVNATEGIVNGKFDLIIGMDIITMGDFSISNYENKTMVSFRIPSIRDIDYLSEAITQKHEPFHAPKVPNLNDPCHCGSGKKYKHCCAFKKR